MEGKVLTPHQKFLEHLRAPVVSFRRKMEGKNSPAGQGQSEPEEDLEEMLNELFTDFFDTEDED